MVIPWLPFSPPTLPVCSTFFQFTAILFTKSAIIMVVLLAFQLSPSLVSPHLWNRQYIESAAAHDSIYPPLLASSILTVKQSSQVIVCMYVFMGGWVRVRVLLAFHVAARFG